MHQKLALKGPLGVPTPDHNNTIDVLLVETMAVIFIHLVRISVIVDDAGQKVKEK